MIQIRISIFTFVRVHTIIHYNGALYLRNNVPKIIMPAELVLFFHHAFIGLDCLYLFDSHNFVNGSL